MVDTNHSGDQIGAVTAEREIVGPPLVPTGGVSAVQPECPAASRAALYIDGFNLYHAIDGLGKDHLKWVNLWKLAEMIIPSRSQRLVKVVYCTAKKKGDEVKMRRHEEYLTAQRHHGVTILLGHFIDDSIDCRGCGRVWDAPREKESDVNLALSIIDDAYQDVFDHAYLVTADSDQGATARMMKERFPSKALTSVAPPGMQHSKSIRAHTHLQITINETHLSKCLLGKAHIEQINGKPALIYRRPAEYDPPPGFAP